MGVYRAGWPEIVKRFGGNRQRRQLLKGLKEALDLLKRAGCRRVYLDGSFVTHKDSPNDVDVCWDVDGVDPLLLDSVLTTVEQLRRQDSEQNSFLRKRRNVSRPFWIFSNRQREWRAERNH